VEERPLDLVELPLAVMDGTLQEPHYRGLKASEAERAAAAVLARALRSGGAVSLLWHNNRFDRRVSRGYDKVYWRLLDQTWHGAGAGAAGSSPAGRGDRVTRVLHLSVLHKPDDRITNAVPHRWPNGLQVIHMVPGPSRARRRQCDPRAARCSTHFQLR
jgi:hypothetical protein